MKKQQTVKRAIRSLGHYIYLKEKEASSRYLDAKRPEGKVALWGETHRSAALPKVAFLCDEMTWQDYKDCCNSIFLHPAIWREQLERFQPEIFFCEAAWSGIQIFEGVWRGRVYKDSRVLFENRKILLEILKYCKEKGIWTVFWGKEDPTFFQHTVYDFTQTALLFDIICTTAQECVSRYQKLGHHHVCVLPFGVDTRCFNSNEYAPQPGTVVFAGSWFSDQYQRCSDLEMMLDYALKQGWHLDIYDRKWDIKEKKFRFPQKYQPYLKPAVPYELTPELFHRYEYAINVNTVVYSATMCSRRLLQVASCGNAVLCNESAVLNTLSDCLDVWHLEQQGVVLVRGETEKIARNYSTSVLFQKILNEVEAEKGSAHRVASMV